MNSDLKQSTETSSLSSQDEDNNGMADPEDSEDLFKPTKSSSSNLPRALNPATSLSPRPESSCSPRSSHSVRIPPLSSNVMGDTALDNNNPEQIPERVHRRAALFRDVGAANGNGAGAGAAGGSSERIHLRQHHGPSSSAESPPRSQDAQPQMPPSQPLVHDHSGCPACTSAAAASANHPYYDYYDPYHLPHHPPLPQQSPSSHYYQPQPPHPGMYSSYGYPQAKHEPHHHYHQYATDSAAAAANYNRGVPYYHQQRLQEDYEEDATSSVPEQVPPIPEPMTSGSAPHTPGIHSAIKKDGKSSRTSSTGQRKQVRIKVDSSAESQSVSPAKMSPTAVRRKRSAELSELQFEGFLAGEKPGMERFVRKWRNSRNLVFYDCACGRRKAVHDLKKIKTHVERIHLGANASEPILESIAAPPQAPVHSEMDMDDSGIKPEPAESEPSGM
eukprot:TRINITY_DN6385_c0_g1_i1.p1 TRINITY_DN6385_c0_g1~~TRINITY_DN6385_c0_g1_i1.p1  ORF type:complete len:499 (+),score=108.65 TRINITY_DN6385_c0_g1_i1:163-1497(+)